MQNSSVPKIMFEHLVSNGQYNSDTGDLAMDKITNSLTSGNFYSQGGGELDKSK